MLKKNFRYYLCNCFLLFLPIIVWNVLLTDELPNMYQAEVFQHNIPPIIVYGESISRILLFIISLLMPLSIRTTKQRRGMLVYTIGVLIYFASWIVLIYSPESRWSNSLAGFMAPAYTPLLWLGGIAMTGNRLYSSIVYKQWMFATVALIFLIFHNAHAFLVYSRSLP